MGIIDIIKQGTLAVSMACFIFCGILTIIVMLWVFWTTHNITPGIIATLGIFGFCNFISLIYNLMKINQIKK